MKNVWLLGALVFASTALAQVDGGTRLGVGLFLSEPLLPVEAAASHVHWIDDQGRAILSLNNPNLTAGRMGCRRLLESGSTDAGVFTTTSSNAFVVGVRPGENVYTVFRLVQGTLEVSRAGCGVPPVSLGTVPLTGELTWSNEARTVPMDLGGAVFFGTRGGIARVELTPTLSVSLWITNAQLDAATGGTFSATSTTHLSLMESVALPDGSLVLQLQTRPASRTLLVRRSPTGVLSELQRPPYAGGSHLAFHAESDALVFRGSAAPALDISYSTLGFIPLTAPRLPQGRDLPFPATPFDDLKGFVTAADGGVWGWRPEGLRPLHYDPAEADFDRDGLSAAEESPLGLSDIDEDFDSDGIPDGVEVNAFGTDPKLASSVPPLDAPAEGIVYAPSFIAARYLKIGCASGATGGRVCNAGRAAGCGTDPANVCHFSDLSAAPPGLFAPDGGAVAVNVPSTALEPIPLSATAVVYLDRQPGGEQVVRVRSDGSTFPVLRAVRSRCPVAGNEAELLACSGAPPRHQWIDPDARFTPLAFDPVLRRAHVLVTTSTGLFHYAVGENDVLYLGDVSREQRFPATQASHLRTGGFLLHHQRSGPWLGVSLVDSLLRPIETTQQYVHRPPQHWFRAGLSGFTTESHLLEQSPGTSECGVSNGIFVCDINPPRPPVYRARDFSLELVPVGPALERGEVLMWSPSRVYTFTGAVVPPGGLSISPDDYRAVGWLLWRVTPLGGVVEWMDAARFKAQLTPADLALAEATPLSAIGHIGVSPDGLAICLAEPAAQRLWELRLDGTSRELASIALAGAGTACAYDEQNRLVRAGAALELSSGPVTLPTGPTAAALLRVGGRWVVRREGAPLLCVTDEGEVQTTTLSPVAIAPAFGGVAWVDANDGFVSTIERLCDESAAMAGFATGDVPLWSRLYGTFTFRSVRAATGALAVRPDGMVTLGIATAIVAGSAPHVPALVPLVPFHAFPRYVPLAGAPMPGTEGFRLRELVEAPLSTRPGEVRAMAVIPGAEPGRDWGYFPERPGEPDMSSPDAGVVDGGPGSPDPAPAPGCGCTSGSATVTLLLGLALLRRRARPWGSPRSPTR